MLLCLPYFLLLLSLVQSIPQIPTSNYSKANNVITALKAFVAELGGDDADPTPAPTPAPAAQANTMRTVTFSDPIEPDLRSILRAQVQTPNANNTTIVHVNCSYQKTTELHTIVDNGADTSLLGEAFHILEQDTMRTVEVHGFNDSRGAESGLHIGSGICAIDLPGKDTILLQVNEGVIMKQGKSLLSVNQI